jgi:hypothetical protein
MELTLPLIALPAVSALILKAGVYFYTRSAGVAHSLETRLFLLFLLFLTVQNIAEVFGAYRLNVGGSVPHFEAKLFYAATGVAMACLFHLALHLAAPERSRVRTILPFFVYGWVALLELLLPTSWLIQDFEILDYGVGLSVTRVPGPLYFLFEFYVIAIFTAVVGLSFYGSKKHDTLRARIKCRMLLVAIIPLVIYKTLALLLLHFDMKWMNWTVGGPVVITYFLAVMAYAIHSQRFLDKKLSAEESAALRRQLAEALSQLRDFEHRLTVLRIEHRLLHQRYTQLENNTIALPGSTDAAEEKPFGQCVAEYEARLISRALDAALQDGALWDREERKELKHDWKFRNCPTPSQIRHISVLTICL